MANESAVLQGQNKGDRGRKGVNSEDRNARQGGREDGRSQITEGSVGHGTEFGFYFRAMGSH